jgi:DNA (cytosine-5)-methyltransferase 1
MRPRLLDAYCCEGGAAAGYARVGFDVVGVDIEPRFAKRYPFEFHQGDAIDYIQQHGHEFDAIHASPPCQHASAGTRAQDRSKYPALIEPTRAALLATGKPYVIENVSGSALHNPVTLCGSMFDLATYDQDGIRIRLERHRLFESNVHIWQPSCFHDRTVQVAGAYGGARTTIAGAKERGGGYTPKGKDVRSRLLGGVDWMTLHGMSQCVPPAYAEYIGRRLLDTLERAA